jgi:hypothetical protein
MIVSLLPIDKKAGEVAAENIAEAESRTGHTKASQACTDVLCCFRFHVELL